MLTLFRVSSRSWRKTKEPWDEYEIAWPAPIMCGPFLPSPRDLPTACIYLPPLSLFHFYSQAWTLTPPFLSYELLAWELFLCNTQCRAGHPVRWWPLCAHPLPSRSGTQGHGDAGAVCSLKQLTHSHCCEYLINARPRKRGSGLLLVLLSPQGKTGSARTFGALNWTLHDCLSLILGMHNGDKLQTHWAFSQRSMQSPEVESFPPTLKHNLSLKFLVALNPKHNKSLVSLFIMHIIHSSDCEYWLLSVPKFSHCATLMMTADVRKCEVSFVFYSCWVFHFPTMYLF